MECNKDEALRAMDIAKRKVTENDYTAAKRIANKALNLYPKLDGLKQVMMLIDVYISAGNKISGGESDWYGILGVDPLADEEAVKKQYKRLALLLHPDKNKCDGAEGAFKLVSSAWSLLSDKVKRMAYDRKRKLNQVKPKTSQKQPPKKPPSQPKQPPNQQKQSPEQPKQPPHQQKQPPNQWNQPPPQQKQTPNQPKQSPNQWNQPPPQPKQPPNQPKQPPNQPKQPPNQPKQPPNQWNQPPNQPKQPPNQPKQPPNQQKQSPNQWKQPPPQQKQSPNQPKQPPNQQKQSSNQWKQPPPQQKQSPNQPKQPPPQKQSPNQQKQPPNQQRQQQQPSNQKQQPSDQLSSNGFQNGEVRSNKPTSFWTMCNKCRTQYEYESCHLNKTLHCRICSVYFKATKKENPPTSIYGTPQATNKNKNDASCGRFSSPTVNVGHNSRWDFSVLGMSGYFNGNVANKAGVKKEVRKSEEAARGANSDLKVEERVLKKLRTDHYADASTGIKV